MGLLDAYMSTWSKARKPFGDGVPDDGSRLTRVPGCSG